MLSQPALYHPAVGLQGGVLTSPLWARSSRSPKCGVFGLKKRPVCRQKTVSCNAARNARMLSGRSRETLARRIKLATNSVEGQSASSFGHPRRSQVIQPTIEYPRRGPDTFILVFLELQGAIGNVFLKLREGFAGSSQIADAHLYDD